MLGYIKIVLDCGTPKDSTKVQYYITLGVRRKENSPLFIVFFPFLFLFFFLFALFFAVTAVFVYIRGTRLVLLFATFQLYRKQLENSLKGARRISIEMLQFFATIQLCRKKKEKRARTISIEMLQFFSTTQLYRIQLEKGAENININYFDFLLSGVA